MALCRPLYLHVVAMVFFVLSCIEFILTVLRCSKRHARDAGVESGGPSNEDIFRNLSKRGLFGAQRCKTGFTTVGAKRSDLAQIWYCDSALPTNNGQNDLPRVLLINGLGRPAHDFEPFIEHTLGKFHVVAYDSRLVGLSGRESARCFGRTTSTSMAEDALDIISNFGWNDGRGVHIVGYSLGGMIAQELCFLAPPGLIHSLVLGATYAGGSLTSILPPACFHLRAFMPQVRQAMISISENFVEAVAQGTLVIVGGKQEGRHAEDALARYRQRAALYGFEMGGVQAPVSTLLRHTWAAAGHYVSPERLCELRSMPFPKFVFATSQYDNLVSPHNAVPLAAALGAPLKMYRGAGHDVWVHGERVALFQDLTGFIVAAHLAKH